MGARGVAGETGDAAVHRGVLDTLLDTGAIGATSRQVARRAALPFDRVEEELGRLARSGEALRIGRGLWVLSDYRTLEKRDGFVEPASYLERFERENGLRLGTYRGPITFRSNDHEPVHRWWPYVQGYSAEFVRETLRRQEVGPGSSVFDPFAGSGTTLVEARRAGARAVGCELLPPAALSARVKSRFELRPGDLARSARELTVRARRASAPPLPFLKETRRQFSPGALEELGRLRVSLPRSEAPAAEAVRLAFGRILIPSSRLRRSPCLGYGRPEEPGGPTPLERFGEAVEEMAADLGSLSAERTSWGPPSSVFVSDARTLELPSSSVDLVVTSPPYVNGMDYVMNYKVDLAWLGYARSYADLNAFRGRSVACDNLPRSETEPYLSTAAAPDPWLAEILERIRSNVLRKSTYRRDDAHAVVHRYFADLVPVMRRAYAALRPGGRFLLVVGDSLIAGTYVPGDLLLARIGEGAGFEIESVDLARSRRSGQRRSFELRETIVTLRRPTAS